MRLKSALKNNDKWSFSEWTMKRQPFSQMCEGGGGGEQRQSLSVWLPYWNFKLKLKRVQILMNIKKKHSSDLVQLLNYKERKKNKNLRWEMSKKYKH